MHLINLHNAIEHFGAVSLAFVSCFLVSSFSKLVGKLRVKETIEKQGSVDMEMPQCLEAIVRALHQDRQFAFQGGKKYIFPDDHLWRKLVFLVLSLRG